jgi:hypothetical protein
LTKRRVGDADKTLKAEEARRKLNLRYEMMSMKTLCNEEGECLEEQALISGNSWENTEIAVKLGTVISVQEPFKPQWWK